MDQHSELWYQEANRYSIDRIVFVTVNGNENMLMVVSKRPDRFIRYAHHDPAQVNVAEELEKFIKAGLKGRKILGPIIIHDVAKQFRRIRFIVPHFGCRYIFETLSLFWAYPNVYVETSGSNQWTRWMPHELNLEMLFRKYRETISPERTI